MSDKITHELLRPLRAAITIAAAASLIVLLAASTASAASPTVGFGFHSGGISGFPASHGSVALTGGGALNLAAGSVHAGGGFTCTSDATQGLFTGCLTGQGVRWDTEAVLAGTMFKCTGSAGESLKPANSDADTVVLKADFYRAGDGIDESFTAQMIVSASDIADDIPGIQNVWVQGVGCGTALVHFGA